MIAAALVNLQVPRDRILVEGLPKTTHEQSIAVTRLLQSRGIGRFVLVTSPTHMSRAPSLVFRAQDADVVPSAAPLDPRRLAAARSLRAERRVAGASDDAVYDYASYMRITGRAAGFAPCRPPPDADEGAAWLARAVSLAQPFVTSSLPHSQRRRSRSCATSTSPTTRACGRGWPPNRRT